MENFGKFSFVWQVIAWIALTCGLCTFCVGNADLKEVSFWGMGMFAASALLWGCLKLFRVEAYIGTVIFFLFFSGIGILAFWALGFNNLVKESAMSFFSAGTAAYFALAHIMFHRLRARTFPY